MVSEWTNRACGVTVPGVTEGPINNELRRIATITRVDGTSDLSGDALAVTAGSGNGPSPGMMPGKGKIIWRDAYPTTPPALGTQVCDVYLNNDVYWENIPGAVWRYTLGGYQVLKKWLSYRENSVLSRSLKSEEAREVQLTCRRIAALILLGEALDANYEAVKGAVYGAETTVNADIAG